MCFQHQVANGFQIAQRNKEFESEPEQVLASDTTIGFVPSPISGMASFFYYEIKSSSAEGERAGEADFELQHVRGTQMAWVMHLGCHTGIAIAHQTSTCTEASL